MQTRKDLYQAHRLMTQRVALALLQGRPGAAESPLRRTGVGALCGVMVVVLVAAGFGVSGLLVKGGARGLTDPGVVIIEKETGAAYAYSAPEGRLIPFVNYASARLAMPTTKIYRKLVSSASLARYPRGPITGIQGAPVSLPDPRRRPQSRWSLCVRDTRSTAGVSAPAVTLIGGEGVRGRMLGDAEGILLRGGSQIWLVWRNTRMKVSPQAARVITLDQPVSVDERWLNGLPQAPDFAAPRVEGWGREVTGPDGAKSVVGQVYRVRAVAGTPDRWFVLLSDGRLAGVSPTQAGLLLEAAGRGTQGLPRDIAPRVAAAHASPADLYSRLLPETPPRPVPYDPGSALCAVYGDTGRFSTEVRFTLGGTVPAGDGGGAPRPAGAPGGLDHVALRGGGAFVGTLAAPGQRPQAYAIVTEQGTRHPIPTSEEVEKLGYSANDAIPMPANLLQLFREGPALTSEAAVRPVSAS